MALALSEHYPGVSALSVAGIASLPTPLEPLQIEQVLEKGCELWVKRDDATYALYGGNKVRKLDFLLGQALAEHKTAVVTFGAYGSNHALATAVHARALGIEPHIIMSPQAPTAFARDTLLAHAGLNTQLHPIEGWEGEREAKRVIHELAERDGMQPAVFPMGGSSALGAVGFVNAAAEVGAGFDAVYVPCGTLGTAVGLAVGFAALGANTRVVAVRVTPAELANGHVARTLTEGVVTLMGSVDARFPRLAFENLAFDLRDEFFEPGYAVPTAATEAAVALAARSGLALETTYTGKALQALETDVRLGTLSGGKILFWDTYHSGPKPPPGPVEVLPPTLQEYVAECEQRFGR
ncbi:MAG: pyridoxal-phosphate dependent enzyme [Coriobacteriia bacterium]|jgi:1-aminocyclopropane-1-carboxylate deaminase/D-cysteine desulfhydrase-like pyridoxal-dependent ACC family enzyme|nr:pyridoxal-phosphate dependent enzyme [Coriobacteriia bacterium]